MAMDGQMQDLRKSQVIVRIFQDLKRLFLVLLEKDVQNHPSRLFAAVIKIRSVELKIAQLDVHLEQALFGKEPA